MTKDYYTTLGVPRNATKEDIKKAYRSLAHKFHPDKGGDAERFKEINEAYHILSDDKKRAQYDQFGQVFEGGGAGPQQGWPGGFRFDFGEGGPGGFGDLDFSDVFEDLFGGFGGAGRGARGKERRGKDMRLDLKITFEESIMGGKREIQLSRLARCVRCKGTRGEPGSELKVCAACQGKGNVQSTKRTFLGSFTQVTTCGDCFGTGKQPEKICTECRGRGVANITETLEVFIPKGVREGEMLKITGKGEASVSGGIPGDLFIVLQVEQHSIFQRQGNDIVMRLPLKLSQAIIGGKIDIETLDGAIGLKVPEGAQSGDILKVRGKGAYISNGYGRGDLLVEIKVETPKRATKRLKEIAEELHEEGF